MNDQPPPPVRLPGAYIPEGTAPWRSADARRWLAAVPSRRWAHPVWLLLTLVLAGVLVWLLPDPPPELRLGTRSEGRTAPALTAVEFGEGYVPLTARAASDVLISTSYASTGSAWLFGDVWVWTLTTLFLGFLLLEAYWILRRPALALAVLGPLTAVVLLSDAGVADAGPAARIVVGAAALLAGLLLLYRLRARARRRAHAEAVAGAYRHAPPPVPVRRPHRLLAPAAAAVLLAVAGYVCVTEWPFGVNWLLLMSGTLGTGLLVHVLANWWTARRFARRPQPVLRVLVREGEDGRVCVYAADDHAASEPLLRFRTWGGYAGERAGQPAPHGSVREAVLYGLPSPGAQLTYVAAVDGPDGRVAVERSTTPAALAPAVPDPHPPRTEKPMATQKLAPTEKDTVSHPSAPGSPRTLVASWSAGPVSRTAGALVLLFEAATVWNFFDDERTLRSWLLLVTLPFALTWAATALNWRVTTDRSGVWVAGGWRVEQVPWAEIEKVECAEDRLVLGALDGTQTAVRPTGWAGLDRRTAKGHVAGRAAEGIRAMLADPESRPAVDSTPADQGTPLGPVIVLVAALIGAALTLL
ncbi:hypothetical protein [Streptomyces candidus]|uniref:PH domain-containing protein n=1 Tax=Streptomyces candidus TaxID=67283 RepID=A0A7X0LRN1_9ACTN|nr:hypothetical protein [Streptomyces candidus]MBB6437146.1 hypothetical protein [Streptomyces candidus]